jgi:hypothetical protein
MGSQRPAVWIWVRIVIITIGSASSAILGVGSLVAHGGWPLELFGFALSGGLVGVVLTVGMQAINPRSASVWTRPDWHANPFSVLQPVQFFHLMALYCVATAGAMLALALLKRAPVLPALLFGCLGAGMFLGIKCCVVLYTRKFA